MRAGFTTSVVLHVLALGFGLITLGTPKPLDAGATESLPVDIVPLEELTQIQEGDKTASLSDKPTPKPTTKPQTVPDAKIAGDNDADLSTPPTPEAKPQEVKVASAPPPPTPSAKPAPPQPKPVEPAPKPVVEKKPAPPEPVKEAKPVPAPQVKPEPEPAPEAEPIEQAEPEEKPEPKPVEKAEAKPEPEEEMTLPDAAPLPVARPKPAVLEAKSEVADAKPQKKPSESKQASDDQALEEQVAMLLNKQKPSGGGAKRSQAQKASLGGKQTTGAKLSQGEMDALSGQLSNCWGIDPGLAASEGLRVSIRFNVDAAGKLEGTPTVDASSGKASFDQSAVRAVLKCDRQGLNLPKDRAQDVYVVNFDPGEMF